MVSQFISSDKVRLLGDLDFDFPKGIHAVGRLDLNSEGLLILTTNKKVTRLLFMDDKPHERVYLVQVNNILSNDNLEKLRTGVSIRIKSGDHYTTPACKVEIVDEPGKLFRTAFTKEEHGKHTWLLITLTEGKFRQVRKMMMAVKHRCKRLIRVSIGDLVLGDLEPGQVKEMDEKDFFEKLHIKYNS